MNVRLDAFIGITSIVCVLIVLGTLSIRYNTNKTILREEYHDQIHIKLTGQDSLLIVTDSLLLKQVKKLKQEDIALKNEVRKLQRSVYSNRYKINTIKNLQNDE